MCTHTHVNVKLFLITKLGVWCHHPINQCEKCRKVCNVTHCLLHVVSTRQHHEVVGGILHDDHCAGLCRGPSFTGHSVGAFWLAWSNSSTLMINRGDSAVKVSSAPESKFDQRSPKQWKRLIAVWVYVDLRRQRPPNIIVICIVQPWIYHTCPEH